MPVRGAAPPPSNTPTRPSDPLQGALFDAKNATNGASATIAAAALNQLVKDASKTGGGDDLALHIFKSLRGADQLVIRQFRDLVIGDTSYSLQRWQASELQAFADAAMGSGNWPAGTNN